MLCLFSVGRIRASSRRHVLDRYAPAVGTGRGLSQRRRHAQHVSLAVEHASQLVHVGQHGQRKSPRVLTRVLHMGALVHCVHFDKEHLLFVVGRDANVARLDVIGTRPMHVQVDLF